MMDEQDKSEKVTVNKKPSVRPRGIRMDFSPRPTKNKELRPRPRKNTESNNSVSDLERQRHEIARREIQRREAIHRQIEAQREEDIIARRRAMAARKDLTYGVDMGRKRNPEAIIAHERELESNHPMDEIERKRALIEERALLERRRILAQRRAKQAQMNLERRRANDIMAHKRQHVATAPTNIPVAPSRPLPDEPEIEDIPAQDTEDIEEFGDIRHELGSIEDFEADLKNLEENDEYVGPNDEEDIRDFVEDNKSEGFFENVKKSSRKLKLKEDTSANNDNYVLGGYSPFINTEVEKRPLSGGAKSFQSTEIAATRPRGRYVPYEEPIPHKNIYARSVAKEKHNKKEVPTMVVNDAPKSSKVSLVVAVILTIILGATVGAIAYLALFQK